MKTILTLAIVLLTAVGVQAQKKPSLGGALEQTNPVSDFFGSDMVVTSHMKNNRKVSHMATDHVVFGKDGVYTEVFFGSAKTGTWDYNGSNKTMTIVIGGETAVYDINNPSTTSVQLTRSGESLVLEKK